MPIEELKQYLDVEVANQQLDEWIEIRPLMQKADMVILQGAYGSIHLYADGTWSIVKYYD